MNNQNIYLVITEDRHTDIDVTAFMSQEGALEFADIKAKGMVSEGFIVEKTENESDKVSYFVYTPEGDTITVKPGLLML